MADSDSRLALTGIQQELHKALVDENPACAEYYRAGVATLNDPVLPDRLAVTAHSFRELLEKLPNDGATDNAPDLNTNVRILHEKWTPADNEARERGGERWDGTIGAALRIFLHAADAFFRERLRIGESRNERTTRFLNRIEASSGPLPPDVQRRNAKEWNALRQYFSNVSHHQFPEDDGKFRAQVTKFEVFLHARLKPRPTADFAAIDALMRED